MWPWSWGVACPPAGLGRAVSCSHIYSANPSSPKTKWHVRPGGGSISNHPTPNQTSQNSSAWLKQCVLPPSAVFPTAPGGGREDVGLQILTLGRAHAGDAARPDRESEGLDHGNPFPGGSRGPGPLLKACTVRFVFQALLRGAIPLLVHMRPPQCDTSARAWFLHPAPRSVFPARFRIGQLGPQRLHKDRRCRRLRGVRTRSRPDIEPPLRADMALFFLESSG